MGTPIRFIGCTWHELDGRVKNRKPNEIFNVNTAQACQDICMQKNSTGCRSLTHCSLNNGDNPGSCLLFNKELNGTEFTDLCTDCKSYYRTCPIGNLIKN